MDQHLDGGGYIDLHQATRGPMPKPNHGHQANGKANGKVPPWENVGPTYRYTDAAGKLILEVVRTLSGEPRFLQRQPNGKTATGEMKWRWSVKDIPNHDCLLYRLPELRDAPLDDIVWICEGEKDADRLRDAGLVATTNIGGGGKWRDEYAAEFRGKPVVILQDNDQTGRDRRRCFGEDPAAAGAAGEG
jgi:hypothetical protein